MLVDLLLLFALRCKKQKEISNVQVVQSDLATRITRLYSASAVMTVVIQL